MNRGEAHGAKAMIRTADTRPNGRETNVRPIDMSDENREEWARREAERIKRLRAEFAADPGLCGAGGDTEPWKPTQRAAKGEVKPRDGRGGCRAKGVSLVRDKLLSFFAAHRGEVVRTITLVRELGLASTTGNVSRVLYLLAGEGWICSERRGVWRILHARDKRRKIGG